MMERINNCIRCTSYLKLIIFYYIYLLLSVYVICFFVRNLIASIISYILMLFIPIYIVYIKDAISTIGIRKLNKNEILKMILFILISMIVIAFIRYFIIHNHLKFKPIYIFFYYLLVGLSEEISIRGFIGSKISIHSRWIGYIIAGVLFALLHIFNSTIEFGVYLIYRIIFLVLIHVIFQMIYDYFHSFIPSTIVHALLNYIF